MTPERRKEIQRSEDASYRTRTSREMDELKERIKALESLLAESSDFVLIYACEQSVNSENAESLISRIDAILPKTEEVK